MFKQRRSQSAYIRKTVTYECNQVAVKQSTAIVNKKCKNPTQSSSSLLARDMLRPNSQPPKTASHLQDAKTQRITTSLNTVPSTHALNQTMSNQSSKLTSIPILTNSLQVHTLTYSNHKIHSIPKNFSSHYSILLTIDLSYNQIADFLPLCYIQTLQKLNLSHNLITHVPKQIKKLTNLTTLNLAHNKLWYLTQIIPLKDLIQLRFKEFNFFVQINLQENLVIKSNQKAINKLLNINSTHLNTPSQQNYPKLNALIQKTLQQNQSNNKQNLNPYFHNQHKQTHKFLNHHNQNLHKTNQSKTLNQSLLDVSAIIAPLPTNQIHHKVPNSKETSLMTVIKKKTSIQPQKPQFLQSETPLLSHHKNLTPNNISHTVNILFTESQQTPSSPVDNSCENPLFLFKKIDSFDQNFLEHFQLHFFEIKQIQKKFKLIQNLKEIPQDFKSHFLDLNSHILIDIQKITELLKPFTNFYDQKINSIQKLAEQTNLSESNGSETFLKGFQQKILEKYLNSVEIGELKWFEVWLNQYGKYKKMHTEILNLFNRFIPLLKKVNKLAKVVRVIKNQECEKGLDAHCEKEEKVIFEEKQPFREVYSSKKASSKKQLNNLLFSDNKYQKTSLFASSQKESLLLSQKGSNQHNTINFPCKKALHSENKDCCLQCPIKNQEITQLSLLLDSERVKNEKLSKNVQELKEQIDNFKKNDELYHKVQQKQSEIIEEVQFIKPCTYQNVLLSQALCIEDLIVGHEEAISRSRLLPKDVYPWGLNGVKGHIGQENSQEGQIQARKRTSASKKEKTQLQQFLLTQQSTNSHKKIHPLSSQRTYFKSNGTLPFSHSEGTKNLTTGTHKLQYSSKNQQNLKNQFNHSQKTKFNSSGKAQISQTVGRKNQLARFESKALAQHPQQENDKNQVFQKIVVREFNQEKVKDLTTEGFQIQSEEVQKLNEEKHNLNKQKFIQIQNNVWNFQSSPQINSKTLQQEFKPQFVQKPRQPSSSGNIDPKKRSKSHFNLRCFGFQQFSPFGYDYENIQFKQNVQYQNYLKYHLRNNIKEKLAKKNFEDSRTDKDLPKRFLSTDSLLKPSIKQHLTNFNSNKWPHINERTHHSPTRQAPAQMKKNLSAKYIKQCRYTDGK